MKTVSSKQVTENSRQIRVNTKSDEQTCQSGQALVLVLIFLAVITFMTLVLFSRVGGFVRFTGTLIAKEQATQLAEAGIDYAVWQLNETSGTPATDPLAVRVGVGEFKTKVEDVAPDKKLITSTGCIPSCLAAKKQTRVIKVEVTSGGGISFYSPYTWQTQNGDITGKSCEGPVGTATGTECGERDAVKVYGGISSGGEVATQPPFSFYGDIWAATNIRIPGNHYGKKYPNTVPAAPLPAIDIAYWKAEAEKGTLLSGKTLQTVRGVRTFGPAKVKGNLKFDEKDDKCEITITGTVWVTGYIAVSGECDIKLDESFGSKGTVVIAEENIHFFYGSEVYKNSQNSYLLFVSTGTGEDPDDAGILLNVEGGRREAIFYSLSEKRGVRWAALGAGKFEGAMIGVSSVSSEVASAEFHPPVNPNLNFCPDPDCAVDGGGSSSWQIRRGTYRFAD